jgi:Subtilase family
MATTAPEQGQVEAYKGDELVVDLEHLSLVMNVLGERLAVEVEHSGRLGLALVRLPDTTRALEQVHGLRTAAHCPLLPGSRPTQRDRPLDALLSELRAYFGAKYGGWFPEFGKNRIVSGPGAAPYPNVGSAKTPVRVNRPANFLAANPKWGCGVRVGVLDTTLYEHEQLAGRYTADPQDLKAPSASPLHWWDQSPFWSTRSLDPAVTGHGTFIAGLIASKAPGATMEIGSILARQNGDAPPPRRQFVSVWQVAKRMVEYADKRVDVVNFSFFVQTDDHEPPIVLARAVERIGPDTVVVAAAANVDERAHRANGGRPLRSPDPKAPSWPAALPGVVAVGALDERTDERASFTPDVAWINFLAPGVDVTSTYPNERVRLGDPGGPARRFKFWARWSGCSFAAAAVTGAIAARTKPGRRTAREAMNHLVSDAGGPGAEHFRVLLRPR